MPAFLVQFSNADTGFHVRRWRKVEADSEQHAVITALHSTGEGRLPRYIRRHGRRLCAHVSEERWRKDGKIFFCHGFKLQLGTTA